MKTEDQIKAEFAAETRSVLAPHLRMRSFRKGQLLWSEGDTDGMLVFLVKGRVKVYRLLPTGKAITLYVFGPGTVFGFMPLLDDGPYPAYAQALEDSEAEVLSRSGLRMALNQDSHIALVLLKHLARRLREALDKVEGLQGRGADTKVASALWALRELAPRRGQAPLILDLPLSAGEFAASLGVTPETFSRSITHLVEKGVLKRLQRNRFQVLDPDCLQKLAASTLW